MNTHIVVTNIEDGGFVSFFFTISNSGTAVTGSHVCYQEVHIAAEFTIQLLGSFWIKGREILNTVDSLGRIFDGQGFSGFRHIKFAGDFLDLKH